jgi:GST-like protein
MPTRDYQGPALDNPSAVHFHQTDISNCCDRVRIALAEKQVPWVNCFYSLPAGDHLTEAFFELNPAGVVPVLVHNGLVVTESNEIIDYLDETFPEPPLRPSDPRLLARMGALMEAAADFHVHIAALSCEFLFNAHPYSPEFFRKRATYLGGTMGPIAGQIYDTETFTIKPQAVKNALAATRRAFAALNAELEAGGPWLLGDQLTLADISWIVQVHRLNHTGLTEIDAHPNLSRWYANFLARDSAREGMLNWETPEAYALFARYVAQRQAEGTDVNAACWRQ